MFAPNDVPHYLSDLEMTWLPWSPGAATDNAVVQLQQINEILHQIVQILANPLNVIISGLEAEAEFTNTHHFLERV